MSTHVFTYGSLMYAPVWRAVCEASYATEPARLMDYARYCVKADTYPAVVPELGASVDGLLYLDVSDADLARLHAFEGSEYVVRQAKWANREFMFYEFVALDRLDKVLWNPQHFEEVGLPNFLRKHVQGYLNTGDRPAN